MNGSCNLAFRLLQIGRKLKNEDDFKICRHDVIVKLFGAIIFLLLSLEQFQFSFNSNVFTGLGVITIFIYKGFDQKFENWKDPFWICTISRDWSKIGIPNLACVSPMSTYQLLQSDRPTAFTYYFLRYLKLRGCSIIRSR